MMNKILTGFARIKRYFKYIKVKKMSKCEKYTHLYVGAPVHSNLGDHQITVSAQEFLKQNGINFIEISMFDYYHMRNLPFKYIKTICLQGGGNFGDVYKDDILIRDDLVRRFKDKKIVVFPQTIYCEDKTEKSEVFVTKKIYDNHNNVVICAREKKTFNEFSRIFDKNEIILAPDIVMSSDYTKKYKANRKGALMLMRSDREKVLSEEVIDNLQNEVYKLGYNVKRADTVISYYPYEIFRKKELRKLFKKIAKAEFVITDRLHGMIFCAITSTPCIVTSNYNFKIEESYKAWLKGCDFIEFVQDLKTIDLKASIKKILNSKTMWRVPDEHFEKLKEELKND